MGGSCRYVYIHKPSKCCNKSSMMMMHRLSNTCLYTRQWKMRPAGMRLATSTETTTGWDRSPYAATSTSTTLTATLNLVRDADFASFYSTATAYLTRLLFFSRHPPSFLAYPTEHKQLIKKTGLLDDDGYDQNLKPLDQSYFENPSFRPGFFVIKTVLRDTIISQNVGANIYYEVNLKCG